LVKFGDDENDDDDDEDDEDESLDEEDLAFVRKQFGTFPTSTASPLPTTTTISTSTTTSTTSTPSPSTPTPTTSKGSRAVGTGPYTPYNFENVFDNFLGDSLLVKYEPPPKHEISIPFHHAHNEDNDDDDNADDHLEEIFVKEKKSEWDVESIISTYSNTDNHPKLIAAEIDPTKKIKLVRGIPQIDKKTAPSPTPSPPPPQEAPSNLGQARTRHEPKEQKKLRKQQVKNIRKENRVMKKDLKVAYKEEEIRMRQKRITNNASAGLVNTTTIHY